MNNSIESLDADTMYQALVEKDESYEGIFFACVKTTGIFCRPVCSARKPKKENVEFVRSTREALSLGYRPCKVCEPLDLNGSTPEWLSSVLHQLENEPQTRITDSDLEAAGLNPNRVRRWFLKHHGMTFQAYQRFLRINNAIGKIRFGDKVIEAAFDSGYESLSAFNHSFKKATGFTPHNSSSQNVIDITRILTPLGPMVAGATNRGICLLEFADRRMLETQFKVLSRRLQARLIPGQNPLFEQLDTELKEYFAGERREFEVPLDLAGTEFQEQVWRILGSIPYGTTRSYKQQAEILGNPNAVRAVARANGENRISIIIPCHRVIGSDGHLTGYGGGLWRKRYLLDLEIAD